MVAPGFTFKVTVNVGNYTIRCTFFQYIGTDNRAASLTTPVIFFVCCTASTVSVDDTAKS